MVPVGPSGPAPEDSTAVAEAIGGAHDWLTLSIGVRLATVTWAEDESHGVGAGALLASSPEYAATQL